MYLTTDGDFFWPRLGSGVPCRGSAGTRMRGMGRGNDAKLLSES